MSENNSTILSLKTIFLRSGRFFLLRNIFILLLLPVCYNAWSQDSAILSGRITDSKSAGINNATVYLLNTIFVATTDKQGDFSITGIPPGSYTVRVFAANYASVTKNIMLSSGKAETLDFQLNNSSYQLDEVVVTAQKKEESLQNIPVSISALSSRQVEEYRLWDTKELSAIVPNLYAGNPGDDRNVTSIRGITTTSYDPAVATYIDGVNQFGLDTYISQLFDVERIEVLKGPQGTLYGRNAMGGVINIITRQPSNTLTGFAGISIGNFNQQRYSAGIEAPLIKNKLFIGVAALYDSRDGFYHNDFTNSSFDDQHSIQGNYYLKYFAGSKWAITLNAKHRNLRNNGAFALNMIDPTLSSLPDPVFELNQNATTTMNDDTYNSALTVNYFGKGFNFTSQSSYQSNRHIYTNPIDGDFSPLDIVTIINNYDGWNKVLVGTQEFKFTSPASSASPLSWTAGTYLFYQDNPVKQATHFGPDALPIYGIGYASFISTTKAKNSGGAVYGQATYAISKKLDVTAGVRFDHEKKKYSGFMEMQIEPGPPFVLIPDSNKTIDFNALSPKAALTYHIMETSNVYVSYSRGYRTGGLTQLSSDPSQPGFYSYKPEYSGNFEAGIKNNLWENRLHLNVAVFFAIVTDAQVPTLILPDAITVTKNAGKLESKGVEAEAAVTPFKGLEATASFGFTNAEFTKLNLPENNVEVNLKGNKQIFTPDITSMLALQYSYELGTKQELKVVVRGEWMYFGRQYFSLDNTISQKPYNLLNTRCGIAAKNFELMFWGRNLQNTEYITYAYDFGDFGAVHLGNPRTMGVTLTGKF